MKIADKIRNMLSPGESKLNNWNVLANRNQLPGVLEASNCRPQLIYKHSHTCSVCFAAKRKINASFEKLQERADMNFVNVIKARAVSTALAEKLNVRHESPQALLVADGRCVWHASHWAIKADKILDILE